MTTRREFMLTGCAGSFLFAAPRSSFAQPVKAPILIGWLNGSESNEHSLAAFRQGLATLGWKEGSRIVLEERWTDGKHARLQSMAEELAAKRPEVIVSLTITATRAATKAAPTTPIVFIGGDPVASGLVASLARPGGMITGVTYITNQLSEKYLELLLAAAPRLKRIGFVIDTSAPNHAAHMTNARRSATQYPVEARYAEVARAEEVEAALSRFAKEGVQALIVMPGQAVGIERQRVVKFAQEQRWPIMAGQPEWAEGGALLIYGADLPTLYRRAASYVDRILKGTKPSELPIEQPTKFELVVNLKTAKALGLTIPQPVLMRADRVIE